MGQREARRKYKKITQWLFLVSKIKDDLVEDERVEDMVTLFKYIDPDIKKHTLHIIYNLANDFNIRPVLCDLSRPIMEFCLTNIISEYKIIQELSLEIVYAICVEEEAFEVFVELDGIKKLFLFIQNKEVNILTSGQEPKPENGSQK